MFPNASFRVQCSTWYQTAKTTTMRRTAVRETVVSRHHGAKLSSFLWNSSDNQSTIVQRSLMEAIGLFLQKDMQISIHVSVYRPEKGGKNYGTAFVYFPRKFSHKLKWYCNTEMVLRFGRLLRIPWVDFASESCIFRNRILLRFSWNNLFQDSFN